MLRSPSGVRDEAFQELRAQPDGLLRDAEWQKGTG